MNTMDYIKKLVVLLVLCISSLTATTQNNLPLTEERLNGKYTNFDSKNKTTTSGEFINNNRVGEWAVHDSLNKVVLKRNYHTAFSFTEKRVNKEEEAKDIKFLIQRDSTGLYEYPLIEESNVVWSKRVWSVLPKKENKEFYKQDYLTKIESLLNDEKIIIYRNGELSEILPHETIDLKKSKLLAISLKKDHFFEKTSKMMQERIVAITFHIETQDVGENLSFSVYYPTDGRKLFSSYETTNNNEQVNTLDDLFFFKNYGDIIYKEMSSSTSNETLDLTNINKYKKQSNEIKKLIIESEHRLWLDIKAY